MATTAPAPTDVLDFQFKLYCRLKVFEPDTNTPFNKTCSLVASASKYGLVFVGTPTSTFKVLRTQDVEQYSVKSGEVHDYLRRTVKLPSPPTHLSVNCDSSLLCVVVEKNGCATGIIYDIPSFANKEITPAKEIRLSATPGVHTVEISWNPTIPNVLTVCKSDKSLVLYEFKGTGIEIKEIPPEAGITCMCWSPKGKQIAVGSQDGKITQYKPDLKAVKSINAPSFESPASVLALQWISNYQFIAVYRLAGEDGRCNVVVVDAPKAGETKFTNYEDICYSYGAARPQQFYVIFQGTWNILMAASSNSMEVGVLGYEKDTWTQWILGDAARAELPLSTDRQDTLPVGFELDTATTKPVPWGESTLPPAPFIYLLSDHGLLCCFSVVNIREGAPAICQAPEALAGDGGLNWYMKEDEGEKMTLPTTPKTVTVTTLQQKTQITVPTPSISLAPSLSQPLHPQNTTPAQPLFFTSKPQPQTAPETKPTPPPLQQPSLFDTKSTVFGKPLQPILPSPKQDAKPALKEFLAAKAVPSVTPSSTSAKSSTTPTTTATVTSVLNEDTQQLIAKMIREECTMLEAELKTVLHKAKALKIELGSDAESEDMVKNLDALQSFYDEVVELNAGQAAEVHSLKQQLIQTWSWLEDARSRFAASKDPTVASLMRVQPLDPASQHHLDEITRLSYYLETQLGQANRALDEQWDAFQDSCKRTYKMQVPTMEMIFQSMVKQNAVLQKQDYVLKDLQARLRTHTRADAPASALLISVENVSSLEEKLKSLQLQPQDLFEIEYERVLNKKRHLQSNNKIERLREALTDRKVAHVSVVKPQPSVLQLTPQKVQSCSILNANVSPVPKAATVAPRSLDFMQSTPKPAVGVAKSFAPTATPPSTPAETGKTTFNFSKPVPVFGNVEKPGGFDFAKQLGGKSAQEPKVIVGSVNGVGSAFVSTSLASALDKAGAGLFATGAQPVSKPEKTVFSFGNAKPVSTTTAGTTLSANTTKSSTFSFSAPTTSSVLGTTAPSKATFSPSTFATKPGTTFFGTAQTNLFSASATDKPTAINLTKTKTTQSLLVSSVGTTTSTQQPAFAFSSPQTSLASTFNFGAAFSKAATIVPQPIGTVASSSVTSSSVVPPSFKFSTAQHQESANDKAKVASSVASTIPTMFASFTSGTTGISNVAVSTQVSVAPTSTSISVKTPVSSSAESTQSQIVSSTTAKPAESAVPPSTTVVSAQQPVSHSFSFASSAETVGLQVTSAQSPVSDVKSPTGSIFSGGTSQSSFFKTSLPNVSASSTSIFAKAATTSSSTTTTASLFGSPSTTSVSSIFGTASTTSTAPLFGAESTTTAPVLSTASTTTASIFGTASTTTASIFGTASTTTSASGFGIGTTTTSAPTFGTASTTTSAPVFGTGTATTSAPVFGTASTTTSAPVFGTASTTTSAPVFGTTSTTTAPVFGATGTTASAPTFAPASTTTSTSVFGTIITTTTTSTTSPFSPQPVFGSTPKTTTSSIFGTSPAFGTSTAPGFAGFGATATTAAPAFGQPASFGSLFSTTATSATTGSVFGSGQTTAAFGGGGSIFGSPATTASPFGTPTASSGAFGASSAFGGTPPVSSASGTFGFAKSGSTFGSDAASNFSFGGLSVGTTTASSTGFGSTFGQTQAQNPFGRVQDKPAFGGGLFGSPSATTAGGSIFGSNTSTFGSPNQSFGTTSTFGASPSSTFGQQSTFGQSTFGGTTFGSGGSPSGPFSGGGQSVGQTGFGVGSFQKSPGGFGGPPVFGSTSPGGFGSPPAFGGSPAFGAAPSFGSPVKPFGASPPTNAFGATAQSSSFGNLANQSTLGFGNLAQQSQTPSSEPNAFSRGSSFSSWR